MTPKLTPEGLAQTHASAFAGTGWPTTDFARYLDDPNVLVFGTNLSFVVIRRTGPEAEILTLATHPDCQGNGLATRNLESALRNLAPLGVKDVFLEVSDRNDAARALYCRLGFTAFSERAHYYANGASALCMKLSLS